LKKRTVWATFVERFGSDSSDDWLGSGKRRLNKGAWLLFLIVFLAVSALHAISWIYREDYARAGIQMLPGGGTATGRERFARSSSLREVRWA